MIHFFQSPDQHIYAVQSTLKFDSETINKLIWLFGESKPLDSETVSGNFIGPRREMITPWSTNAVGIVQNMGISGILRIEEFFPAPPPPKGGIKASPSERFGEAFDPMLQRVYTELTQDIFNIDKMPETIRSIDDIAAYNEQEGLALSEDEIEYLNGIAEKIGRKLTDSEVFGFSQVNSEHCRHKIFNGQFVIDGEEKEMTLFQLIKQTSKDNPNDLV